MTLNWLNNKIYNTYYFIKYMNKVIAYVFILIGIVILALGIKPVNEAVSPKVPFLEQVPALYLLIAGVVLLVLGLIIARQGTSRQVAEVPIYHGKNIVGFRRMGKR